MNLTDEHREKLNTYQKQLYRHLSDMYSKLTLILLYNL